MPVLCQELESFMQFDFGVVAMVISFLDVVSICRLDSALTSHLTRQHWLHSLDFSSSKALEAWRHRESMQSLRWLSSRKPMITKVSLFWYEINFLEYPLPLSSLKLTDLILHGNSSHRFLSNVGLEQLKAGAFIDLEKFQIWLGDYIPSPVAFTTFVQCCPKLRGLGFRGYAPKFSSEHLRVITQGCPQLEHLGLPPNSGVRDSDLRFVVENCSHLKEIRLVYQNLITNSGLEIIAACSLEKVYINDLFAVTTDGIVSMIKKIAPTLRCFGLHVFSQEKKSYDMVKIVKELVQNRCANLEKLDLTIYEISQPLPIEELLECCSKVRKVQLRCYSTIVRYTEEEVVGDGGLPHLKSLFPLVTFVDCGIRVRRSKRLRRK